MQHELTLDGEPLADGWVLVEASLGPQGVGDSPSLLLRRQPGSRDAEEIPLPVLPGGAIRELIWVPGGTARLGWRLPRHSRLQPRLAIRRVGIVERIARMASRVARTWMRLSREHRREAGLSLWRCLRDLPGAYRDATSFRVPRPPLDYPGWIERFDTLRERDIAAIRNDIRRLGAVTRFHVLIAAQGSEPSALAATLRSLDGQLYRNFACTVLDEAGDTVDGAPAGAADAWLMLVRAGDVLPPHALYWYACEIQGQPDAAIVYADDDRLEAGERRAHPRFKPDWSPEHLRSTHYIGAAAVIRGADAAPAGGVTEASCRHGNYDLMLRVAEAGKKVVHLPAVLLHRAGDAGDWEDPDWSSRAVREHLARRGTAATVEHTAAGCRRIRYALPSPPPLVSVIVPTRDAAKLLRKCLDSVLGKTTYPRIEVLVVDNRSTEPAALAYLEELGKSPRVRVLRYDRPFNYPAINNFAAREAAGEMLCLLNNDVEAIAPGWLEEMAGHLVQEGVGAVGAKLCYPDGRVQHAGMVLGAGADASHLHRYLPREEPGYCHRAAIAHEVSAVTGACLLTWKHLYARLGGLDERLAVGFNDVDYCLRLREEGYRVVVTPHAELLHHESATRGDDRPLLRRLRAMREAVLMRRRWGDRLQHDPYYNSALSLRRPDFSLGETVRFRKPWLDGA